MGTLNVSQRCLQALELGYGIGVGHKLLDEAQVLPPLWALLVLNPLKQFQGLFIPVQSGLP